MQPGRSGEVPLIQELSALLMEENGLPGYQRLLGADALDAVEIHPDDRVVLVEAFVPFIRRLEGTVKHLRVVEKNPQALKGDEMEFYRLAEQAAKVLNQADVVVVSGSAIVHHSLDQLLGFCRAARQVIIAGPTASMYPDPLFDRGVTVLGGIAVHDADELLRVVGEGGSGYFFSRWAEKVAIIRL